MSGLLENTANGCILGFAATYVVNHAWQWWRRPTRTPRPDLRAAALLALNDWPGDVSISRSKPRRPLEARVWSVALHVDGETMHIGHGIHLADAVADAFDRAAAGAVFS